MLAGPAPGAGPTWNSATPAPSLAVAYISYAGNGSITPLNCTVAELGSTELIRAVIVPKKSISPMTVWVHGTCAAPPSSIEIVVAREPVALLKWMRSTGAKATHRSFPLLQSGASF